MLEGALPPCALCVVREIQPRAICNECIGWACRVFVVSLSMHPTPGYKLCHH